MDTARISTYALFDATPTRFYYPSTFDLVMFMLPLIIFFSKLSRICEEF